MDQRIKRRVDRKVKAKKAFLIHLGVFISVGAFFFLLNVLTATSSDDLWFFFPLLPWGAGLLIHYFTVFGFPGQDRLVEKWEEEELMKALRDYRNEDKPAELPPAKHDDLDLETIPRKLRKKDPVPADRNYSDDDLV